MALFIRMDDLDDYYARRDQLRRDGACAYGWIVPDEGDEFGVGVLCVKKYGHPGVHRAWGGHTMPPEPTPHPHDPSVRPSG